MLWLLAIVIGLALGLLAGGSLENLVRIRFRWPWLVIAAVFVRELVVLTPLNRVEGTQYVYALSLAAIVAWTAWHFDRLPGVWLVTAGSLSNLVVILANGARMPVAASLVALVPQRSLADELLRHGHLGQYVLMSGSTHLNFLGDWISVTPFTEAFSPGDLLIALGLALVVLVATHRHPDGEPPRESAGRIVSDPP